VAAAPIFALENNKKKKKKKEKKEKGEEEEEEEEEESTVDIVKWMYLWDDRSTKRVVRVFSGRGTDLCPRK